MKQTIELLAPGGDAYAIKAAIAAGANAVYCGLDRFNARNRATNITIDDLNGILRLAHQHNCQVFLTMNIIFVESELPALFSVLNKIINTSIDGIIVQDFGLFYLLSTYFKGLKIHASTQLTTHNEGQVQFLGQLTATRINLSRELSMHELKALTQVAHKNKVATEVFVHGSYCIGFSGICYMSSVHGGNSGNRGRCSQPCRDNYLTTPANKNYPLNLKDNSAYFDLREIADAEVDSIKIEGRIKEFPYVYTVVDAWRKQLDSFYSSDQLITNNSALYKVFNRDFSNGFLKGSITRELFIDNPRNHSALHLSEKHDHCSIEKAKGTVYDESAELRAEVERLIAPLSIEKAPLTLTISGEHGLPLKISVQTPDNSFDVFSEIKLTNVGAEALSYDMVFKRLKALNDTEYVIGQLDLTNLQPNSYLPFNELTAIKKRLLFILKNSRETVDPIAVPVVKRQISTASKPSLSVLISSPNDLHLCNEASVTVYYQLPSSFKNERSAVADLFIRNRALIPWFPSVIIGDDYTAAIQFIDRVKPEKLVTNNTGVAYEAFKRGINWIAGPYLNIANSFSLLCLKENFNCSGSFISNEISKNQLQRIKKPANFELYYSLYHPLLLMTSRQCLFHQVAPCGKNILDENCMSQCEKTSSITNLKSDTFVIEKSKGNYNCIYHAAHLLNTAIVNDLPNHFSSFFIDLRDIKTETQPAIDKLAIVRLFKNLLNGVPDSEKELHQNIYPSTNTPYQRGI